MTVVIDEWTFEEQAIRTSKKRFKRLEPKPETSPFIVIDVKKE
jgi:hypothetical protein